jgi:hypothetical protein
VVSILLLPIHWKLWVPVLLLALYSVLIVVLLAQLGLWAISQFAETILWFLVAGLPLATSAFDHATEVNFWRDAVAAQLHLIVVLEFVADSHTMPLLAELVLVPILFTVTALYVAATAQARFRNAARLLGAMLSAFGIAILTVAVTNVVSTLQEANVAGEIRSFILSPLLTVGLLPAVYVFALFLLYERLFMLLGAWRDGRRVFGRMAALWFLVVGRFVPHRIQALLDQHRSEIRALRNTAELRQLSAQISLAAGQKAARL